MDGLSRSGYTAIENSSLSNKLIDLLHRSRSLATTKAIRSDIDKFANWCHRRGSDHLPATPETVAEWIADLETRSSVASISRYLSSISTVHELGGHDNPTRSELVRLAMRGLRRSAAGTPRKKAPALRLAQLTELLSSMSPREWSSRRNRAILSVGWCGALRASEICALNIGDVDSTEEGVLIRIRSSKTDQDGLGAIVGVPVSPLSQIVVDWWFAVIRLYGSDNPSAPLFPRIGYSQIDRWFPAIGPRHRLSVRSLHKIISKLLETIGLHGSVHSLRRGMITEAAAAGVSEQIIQRHSRHRSVAVLRGYVDEGNVLLANPLLPIFEQAFSSGE